MIFSHKALNHPSVMTFHAKVDFDSWGLFVEVVLWSSITESGVDLAEGMRLDGSVMKN